MVTKKSANKGKSVSKNPNGRPTKYNQAFCELIIQHMRQGFSIESFPAVIYERTGVMVSKQSIYEWEEVHQEFSDAINTGRALSQKYYEEIARSGMSGNLRRVSKETPLLHEGKAVLDEHGKPLTKKEYDAATFNASSWIFTMKNRFHWTDKLEHSGSIKGSNPIGDALGKIMKDPILSKAAQQIAEKLVEEE